MQSTRNSILRPTSVRGVALSCKCFGIQVPDLMATVCCDGPWPRQLWRTPFFHSRTRRSVFVMRYRNTTEQPHGNLNDRRSRPPTPPSTFLLADALNHQMHKLGPIAMGYFPMRICGLAASPSRHYDRSRALTINVSSPPTPHVLPARRTRFYYLRQHQTAIAVLRTYRHALFNASRRCHRLLLFKIGVER